MPAPPSAPPVDDVTKTRTAKAEWTGDLPSGKGHLVTESGVVEAPYDFASRFQAGDRTNPEELVGAAHAGCFSMALANLLAEDGHEPETIETDAAVELDPDSPAITRITLTTRGRVAGIDEETFQRYAENAKDGCPVSKALVGVDIELDAQLEG